MNRDFILASSSPRRFELLRQIGLSFQSIVPSVDETTERTDPIEIVSELSVRKAAAVAKNNPLSVVIAADTVVTADGHVLGKPHGEGEAFEMLRFLSGRSHFVFTGVTVICDGRIETAICRTEVFFKTLTDEQILAYVRSGECFDKAGAYGIQSKGAVLVDHIDGDYSNVVGLPLSLLYEMLREFDINII
ncbi:MAG: septum formation inhibitor Maf [Clostridia bacterium]|nr:septum formation inhibitor Maf [Clostridia bacterium]